MEAVDRDANLQLCTVENRAIFTQHIQKVFAKCSKLRIKTVERENTIPIKCDEPKLPELNVLVNTIELGILNKELETVKNLKNTLNEQIKLLKILNNKKSCPISQKMDCL